jgi:CheY-like chemotaxis protein/HPt (histidine-containing phosphotransfer) domain-containing protein
MNTHIQVTSVEGNGSVFSFDLILSIAHEALTDTHPMIKKTDAVNSHYKHQRILLVEDNDINREVAIELLTSMDLEVKIAVNGQEGLALAKAEPFDLILMDIQMPVMDGLTATRLIRAERNLQSIPIIAMTANAMTSDYEKSIVAGMNDHLSKPIEMDKLTATLNRWLHTEVSAKSAFKVNNTLFPNTLAPFDLVKAATLTNENSELLHHLLLSFAERYQDAPQKLREWMLVKNFTDIEHLAHSLKGVAGTLAAQELKDAASALENAICNHAYDEIECLCHQLIIELSPAIQAAKRLPALPEVIKDIEIDLSINELIALIVELSVALDTKQLKAIALFSTLKPYFLNYGLHQEVQELNQFLDKLDFQHALPILDRCLLSLKEK